MVTEADLHYEGSLTVDKALLDAPGIREYEMVQIVDVESGARLETYTIVGEPGTDEKLTFLAHTSLFSRLSICAIFSINQVQ